MFAQCKFQLWCIISFHTMQYLKNSDNVCAYKSTSFKVEYSFSKWFFLRIFFGLPTQILKRVLIANSFWQKIVGMIKKKSVLLLANSIFEISAKTNFAKTLLKWCHVKKIVLSYACCLENPSICDFELFQNNK